MAALSGHISRQSGLAFKVRSGQMAPASASCLSWAPLIRLMARWVRFWRDTFMPNGPWARDSSWAHLLIGAPRRWVGRHRLVHFSRGLGPAESIQDGAMRFRTAVP